MPPQGPQIVGGIMKKTLKDKAKEKKATTIGNKNETTPSDEGMEEDPSLTQQLEAELDGAVEVEGDGAAEGDEEAAEVGDGGAARNLDAELDGAAEAAAKKRKIAEMEGVQASRQQWEDMGGADEDEAEDEEKGEYEKYDEHKWNEAARPRTAEEIAEGAGTSSASAGNPGNNLGNNLGNKEPG